MSDERDDYFDVLDRVREIMDENGWNQYSMSRITHIPQSTIASWFRGESQPSYNTIVKICIAAGMTLEEFFRKKAATPESKEEGEGRLYLRVRKRLPDTQKTFLHDLLLFADTWLQQEGF